jgi:hypothetical protein
MGQKAAYSVVFVGETTVWMEGSSHDLHQPIFVIISPSLYWIKYAELSFNSTKKAKLAAKAIFADSLSAGEYEFEAFKTTENGFFLFAYDSAKVAVALKNAGIDINMIKKIFFAQALSEQVKKPILCSEKEALVNIEKTAQMLPPILIDATEKPINIKSTHFDAKRAVYFFTPKVQKQSVSISGQNTLIAVFAVLIISLIIDTTTIAQSYFGQKKQVELIEKKFELPATALERENIIQKFKKADKREASISAMAKALDQVKFDTGEFVESIEIMKDCTLKIKTTRGSFFREKFRDMKILSSDQHGSLYVVKVGLE